MQKDDIKGIIITSIYFMVNLVLIFTSSILLYERGMRAKHALLFAVLYSSMYDIFPIIRGFLKGLFKRADK